MAASVLFIVIYRRKLIKLFLLLHRSARKHDRIRAMMQASEIIITPLVAVLCLTNLTRLLFPLFYTDQDQKEVLERETMARN